MAKFDFELPENTTLQMHNPNFWSRKMGGADRRWLGNDQIQLFNRATIINALKTQLRHFKCDLKNFPLKMELSVIASIVERTIPENFFKLPLVTARGEVCSIELHEKVAKNAAIEFEGIPVGSVGLTIRRTHLRAMPTDLILMNEFIDNDDLQLTSTSLATPVALLASSRDSKWYFAQTTDYRGWIKAEHVALSKNRGMVLDYLKGPHLLATGSRVEIEPDPFAIDSEGLFIQMGDILPLGKGEKTTNLHAQGSFGCYPVILPVRDGEGALSFRTGLVRMSEDVRVGRLKLTTRNVFSQAFKLLGERYGWGGSYNRRDCSRFVQDIFKCFGLELPRDAWSQEKLAPAKKLVFSGNTKERKYQLETLRPGNPLYMPGHTMIYLGRSEGSFFAIHDGSGYKNGEGKPISVHGVFIIDLSLRPMKGEKSYLELLTSALEIDRGVVADPASL